MNGLLQKFMAEFESAVRAECRSTFDIHQIRNMAESDLIALFDSLQKRPNTEKQVTEFKLRIRSACSGLFLDFVGSTPVVRFAESDEFTVKSLRYGTDWFVGAGDTVGETVQSVLSRA